MTVSDGANINMTAKMARAPKQRLDWETKLSPGSRIYDVARGNVHHSEMPRGEMVTDCIGFDHSPTSFGSLVFSTVLNVCLNFSFPSLTSACQIVLLKKVPHPDEYQNSDGQTALHAAAWNSHRIAAQELRKAGAALEARDNLGNTPLMLAANPISFNRANYPAMVQDWIVAAPELDAVNAAGETALIIAAKSGNMIMTWALIKAGADLHRWNNAGESATILSSKAGHAKIVKRLYQEGTSYARPTAEQLEAEKEQRVAVAVAKAKQEADDAMKAELAAQATAATAAAATAAAADEEAGEEKNRV